MTAIAACAAALLAVTVVQAAPPRAESFAATTPVPDAWPVPDGYQLELPAPCREDPARAARPARPRDARYDVCADQMQLFRKATMEARTANKLLLVTFGATWCGWCASLQEQWPMADLLGSQSAPGVLSHALHHVEIGISMTDKGQKVSIPSGEAVLAMLLARSAGGTARTVPFIAVVDPDSNARVAVRNIDDLALVSEGRFDVARLRATLLQAASFLRDGTAPAPEPGWLKRKLLRWWNS